MPSTDLTTEQGLRAYLDSHSIPHGAITLLTGGTANYVYRVALADGKSVIYKHAAPYLHSNANFAFDPTRMDYEDRALEILPPLLKKELPESWVHAVGWYSYDKEKKLLCIEDGGERELKRAYADPKLDIPRIGEELGTWIAALHMCSTQTSLSATDEKDLKANNPIAVAIYRYSYNNLAGALAKYGYDAEFGKYINEEFGSRLAMENECVCHGDFWPGNVLVKFRGEEEKEIDLTVVDWEMTRRGTSATDAGQFAAEAFLLDRFRGGRGLLPAFLNAYAAARQGEKQDGGVVLGKEWVKRMAIHWGVHVAFWPTGVEWTDCEGTEKLVGIGFGVLKAVVEDDWKTLGASELFKDAGGSCTDLWRTS
ncbi:hypothetical protein BU26DRAFT_516049 [Trematosphaeria pertusa]|uniref:Aminoglycoside phosphotransferase domain-containing protein n=1 Tax=Trematosphaeria pertusa TaxID=390896 RepID=A0A6A6ITR4_9PLEO|nr:uncharacterized protein BU26DRAFT_516049 [Trematosphaeria pertusa]KAF2253749.1 hypothetical protein BU26DRAFT_516049 [Trematosphaeria pertusa]